LRGIADNGYFMGTTSRWLKSSFTASNAVNSSVA